MICIVVEGPDGSGKTNLIKRITERHNLDQSPRASTSVGGPVPHLMEWTDKHLDSISHGRTVTLIDRHPVISEPIYGPLTRGALPPGFDSVCWLRERTRQLESRAVVVWCLPPFEVVRANVRTPHTEHMPGVLDNIASIYWAYHVAASRWCGTSIWHDYMKPFSSENVMRFVGSVLDHPHLYRGNHAH